MVRKIIASIVVLFALSAGVAYATTQLTASSVTQVCVSKATGLVRVAATCRPDEQVMTIGGGGNVQATNGTATVPWGETGGSSALPLTGVTLSGRCDLAPPEYGVIANARLLIEAASGQTMDVVGNGQSTPLTRSSILLPPAGSYSEFYGAQAGMAKALVRTNGGTATITVGGYGDPDAQTCSFFWQAVEARN